MLENIKSVYFIKMFFSQINEVIKLKIVKYNKNLQNKLSINLKNYKIFFCIEQNLILLKIN